MRRVASLQSRTKVLGYRPSHDVAQLHAREASLERAQAVERIQSKKRPPKQFLWSRPQRT